MKRSERELSPCIPRQGTELPKVLQCGRYPNQELHENGYEKRSAIQPYHCIAGW